MTTTGGMPFNGVFADASSRTRTLGTWPAYGGLRPNCMAGRRFAIDLRGRRKSKHWSIIWEGSIMLNLLMRRGPKTN